MKSIFLAIICLFAFTSCKLGCTLEDKIVSGVSAGVSSALKCKNVDAVKADVKALAGNLHLCSEKPQGILGEVCAGLASLAISKLGNAVPAKWDCDPALVVSGLSSVVSAACNLIPL